MDMPDTTGLTILASGGIDLARAELPPALHDRRSDGSAYP